MRIMAERNIGKKARALDWNELLDVNQVPIPVKGVRTKTRTQFHTFIGPESVEALRVYFEQRYGSGSRA